MISNHAHLECEPSPLAALCAAVPPHYANKVTPGAPRVRLATGAPRIQIEHVWLRLIVTLYSRCGGSVCARSVLSVADRARRRSSAGVTIVELMISLLLATILIGGLFSVVSSQKKIYQEQLSASVRQTDATSAFEYLKRQIRNAGYGFNGCPRGRIKKWQIATTTVDSVFVSFAAFNDCNLLNTAPGDCPDGSGSDSFVVTDNNFEMANGSTGTASLPGLKLKQNFSSSDSGAASNDIIIDSRSDSNFETGDLAVIWAPGLTKECLAFEVTGVTDLGGNDTELAYSSGSSIYNPGTNDILSGGYSAGALAVRMSSNVAPRYFAIEKDADTDPTKRPPRLVTWTTRSTDPKSDVGNKETVAENIEDMQIATGCDQDVSGLVDEGANPLALVNDEWAYNVTSDSLPTCAVAVDPPDWGTFAPTVVRLSLVVRSEAPVIGATDGFRPALEDRAAGTPTDDLNAAEVDQAGTYRRTILSTTIKTLNLK